MCIRDRGRCAVQQDGVALDDSLKAVPDLGLCALDHLAGRLDVVGNTLLDQVNDTAEGILLTDMNAEVYYDDKMCIRDSSSGALSMLA